MKKAVSDPVNIEIMENEKSADDWGHNALAEQLYWWTDFFNIAFFKSEPVTVPALSFDKTRKGRLGHYVIGRNGLGVRSNINVNAKHLDRPLWETLSTLLHELTHSYEYIYVAKEKGLTELVCY
jgi:hypothetical protein